MSAIDLSRHLALVAADLDRRGYPLAGVVRQAARALAEDMPYVDDDTCICGAEIVQSATGRRRKWCSEKCRRRKRP